MGTKYIVPSPSGDYLALSRSKTGTLFRKQILHKGPLRHPVSGANIQIDDDFLAALSKNYTDKVCDIVQVPVVDDKNRHTEDPLRNLGEVVDLQIDDKGLYAVIDVRNPTMVPLMGKTLLGASAMLDLNGTNQSGKKVGPTLLHVAVTNRPQVTELENYEEILAASADGSEEEIVLLSAPSEEEELSFMELDAILEVLKDVHGIDVKALQEAQTSPIVAQLSASFVTSGLISLSAGQEEATEEQLLLALSALAEKAERTDALEAKAVEDEVDALVLSGHILPAQRDGMLAVAKSDHETFKMLIPATPLVALSAESGVAPEVGGANVRDIDSEIARYSALADSVRKIK